MSHWDCKKLYPMIDDSKQCHDVIVVVQDIIVVVLRNYEIITTYTFKEKNLTTSLFD